jgi:hypothetical protein
MSQGGQAGKSGERQQSATILEFHPPNTEALRAFPMASSDTIYPALSTDV